MTVSSKSPSKNRKPVKSLRPLYDAALMENPHQGGWNKQAALDLGLECARLLKPDMSLRDALVVMTEYKNVAGWKNVVKAAAARFNVINAKEFAQRD